MSNNQLSPNEILELHEILNTAIVNTKKISANISSVKDETLKKFMQNTLDDKKTKMQELQTFIGYQMNIQSNTQNNGGNNNQDNNQNSNQSQ
jgi:hypothetical protein